MGLKIIPIIKRNFQTMINSKLSAIIIILGPILLILITGSALKDNNLRNVEAQIYIKEPGQFTNNLIKKLNARSFNLIEATSIEECKSAVLNSNAQACIEVIKVSGLNLSVKDYGEYNYDVKLYVDFSKQRTVWGVIATVQGVVDEESEKIRESHLSNLRDNLDLLIKSINDNKHHISNAKDTITILEEDFDHYNSELQDAKIGLREIKNLIQSLKLNTLNIKNLGIVDNSILNSIDSNLALIEAKTDETDEKLSRVINQNLFRTYTSKLKENLNEIDEAVSEVTEKLHEVRYSNLKRISDPILLTYSSVSSQVNESEGIVEERLGFLDYLFPSFIMFFILFAGLVFSTSITIKERASGAYIRNITSKANGFTFILGSFITSAILLVIQVGVILTIAAYFLNLSILSNLSSIIIITSLAVAFFILIGITLGYLFNSQESAIISSISLALLFLIFTPIITPVETLPIGFAKIVGLSPLVILEGHLRLSTIFNIPLKFAYSEIISLVITALVILSILFILYKKSKRKEIHM